MRAIGAADRLAKKKGEQTVKGKRKGRREAFSAS